MLLTKPFRALGLLIVSCSLAACGGGDDARYGARTEYLGNLTGEQGVAYNQRSQPNDSVSYWDGDGVPGPVHIEVRLGEQRAYFFKGDQLVGVSQVSTGKEGHNTPTGNYKVLQKDKDHRSSLYGDYVDATDPTKVIQANVENGKDPKPPDSVFLGSSMPYFLRGDEWRRFARRLSAGRAGEPRLHPHARVHGGEFLLQHADGRAGEHHQLIAQPCPSPPPPCRSKLASRTPSGLWRKKGRACGWSMSATRTSTNTAA